MVAKDNEYFEPYRKQVSEQAGKSLNGEIQTFLDAKENFVKLQEKAEAMEMSHQKLIGKHNDLLAKLENASDITRAAKAMASCEQQKSACRQGLNFLTTRVRDAQEKVRDVQNKLDARIKAVMPLIHKPHQAEVTRLAKELSDMCNAYPLAVALVVTRDLRGSFNATTKPWAKLRVPELEDYL